jgi:membrane protease YdiL (CAAX protease family)
MTAEDTPPPGTTFSRFAAVVICAAMFVVFYWSSSYLSQSAKPYLDALAKPDDAPLAWWNIAKHFTRSGIAEMIAVFVPVWLYCRADGPRRVVDLGFNKIGKLLPWIVVLAVEAGLLFMELRGPIGTVPDRFNPYAIYASAMIGVTAAFSEELFFRGFLMDLLRWGGWAAWAQVVISMLFFGLAHLSYIPTDIYGWTIPVFTALAGGFWSVIYIWAGRSLWPTIVAHIINDAVVLPAAFYLFSSPPGS